MEQLLGMTVFAEGEAAADAAAAGAAGMGMGGSIWGMLIPMVLIFVIFYFMIIRPQRKKDKQARDMINAIQVGDDVLTIGGIYGTVTRIKDDTFIIESTPDKTPIHVAKWGIKDVLKYVEDK